MYKDTINKYVIRRDGRLYDTNYRVLGVAKSNAASWCEELGGLWQVFKIVNKGELEVYSIELKDK